MGSLLARRWPGWRAGAASPRRAAASRSLHRVLGAPGRLALCSVARSWHARRSATSRWRTTSLSSPSLQCMCPTQQAATRSGASARRCAPSWRGGQGAQPGRQHSSDQAPAAAVRRPLLRRCTGGALMLLCVRACAFALLPLCRLTNSIMMHGRNNGKKLMAVSSWRHAGGRQRRPAAAAAGGGGGGGSDAAAAAAAAGLAAAGAMQQRHRAAGALAAAVVVAAAAADGSDCGSSSSPRVTPCAAASDQQLDRSVARWHAAAAAAQLWGSVQRSAPERVASLSMLRLRLSSRVHAAAAAAAMTAAAQASVL